MKRLVSALLVLFAVAPAAAQLDPAPGLPIAVTPPSINSARPGVIRTGSDDTTLTVYGTSFTEVLGTVTVLWDGTPLETTVSATHPNSRLSAVVPGSLLAAAGRATVQIEQVTIAGGLHSNEVEIKIEDALPTCNPDSGSAAAARCGAALGELPAVEMVPVHAWYPFVAAPAGGLVRVTNRDSAAQFGNHAIANTTLEDRAPFVPDSGTEGQLFEIALAVDETGWFRIPEDSAPGEVIPFFCPVHSNFMVPPVGGILVQ